MMTSNVNINIYRPRQVVMGRPQRTSRQSIWDQIPGETLKSASVIVLSIVGIMLGITQLLVWQAAGTKSEIAGLLTSKDEIASTNVTLRAAKAQLLSKGQMQAVAAVKFDIHVPSQGQVHRM